MVWYDIICYDMMVILYVYTLTLEINSLDQSAIWYDIIHILLTSESAPLLTRFYKCPPHIRHFIFVISFNSPYQVHLLSFFLSFFLPSILSFFLSFFLTFFLPFLLSFFLSYFLPSLLYLFLSYFMDLTSFILSFLLCLLLCQSLEGRSWLST